MPRESQAHLKLRALKIISHLKKEFPNANCALHHNDPFQLLVATILSAQCTDERVNKVTPVLFQKAPDAQSMVRLSIAELESIIKSTGFYHNKAKNILNCCQTLVDKFNGEVPQNMDDLSSLSGVGRKTANVVLGNAFGVPSMVVDTHVTRISNRLGFCRDINAKRIEFLLMKIVPKKHWSQFSHWIILHGRKTCTARKPMCSKCSINKHCPSSGKSHNAWK